MVQARDNWARLEGRVVDIGAGPDDHFRGPTPAGAALTTPRGWTPVGLHLDATHDVDEHLNLLDQYTGARVVVFVPDRDLTAAHVAVGDHLNLRARLAGPGKVMADGASLHHVHDARGPDDEPGAGA